MSEQLRDNLLQAVGNRHPAATEDDRYDAELLQAWLDRLYAEDIPAVQLHTGGRQIAPAPEGRYGRGSR